MSELPAPAARLLDAVAARDATAAAACFAEDGAFHYAVPHPPLIGREAIAAMVSRLSEEAERIRWDVVSWSVDGDHLWWERVDRFWFDGREAAIECAGVVTLEGDLIRELRDYVDLATWQQRKAGT